MSEPGRRPATFRLDDPEVVVSPVTDESLVRASPRAQVIVTPEPEIAPQDAPVRPPRRRRFAWGTVFWSALGGLVSLGAGLAVTRLVEDLYARAPWLGAVGLALAALAALAILAVVVREVAGLARLRTVERIRARAEDAMARDDRDQARAVVRELLDVVRPDPALARGRADLERHLEEIIDGGDLIRLAERHLMPALDAEARRRVSAAAQRVSVVTAVSPRAAIDLVMVFVTALTLVRGLADLYGSRPGALGLVRLIRHVVAHLAVTGGMAATDSLVQQMLGHGVAAKLSARLGEGVLNGLLTARLGLAAIEVVRPLPFAALSRPAVGDLAGDLLRRREARRGAARARVPETD